MFDTYDVEEFIQEEQTFSVDSEPCMDAYGVFLSDEVDEQEWLNHRLMSYPMSIIGTLPEKTIVRNTGHLGYNWGPEDYALMSKEVYTLPTVVEVTTPNNLDISTGHTRVQVTYYEHGQYVKGNSGNFELKKDIDKVFNSLQTLLTIFPKTKKPECAVRVQLQNKDKNIMRGGRNLSLHNANVPRVMQLLTNCFEDMGWLNNDSAVFTPDPIQIKVENIQCGLSPQQIAPSRDDSSQEVLNNIEHYQNKTVYYSTEDGSPEQKPVISCGVPKGASDCVQEKSQISVQKPGVTGSGVRRDYRAVEAEKEILKLIGL